MVHFKIAGIDVSTEVNADFWALHFIPFRASAVNVTNMTVEFYMKSTGDDMVHWELMENSTFTIGKVDIQMGSSFLNWLISLMPQHINQAI